MAETKDKDSVSVDAEMAVGENTVMCGYGRNNYYAE